MGIVQSLPIKFLSAAVAEAHIFSIHRAFAARTNGVDVSAGKHHNFLHRQRQSVPECADEGRLTLPYYCCLQRHGVVPVGM